MSNHVRTQFSPTPGEGAIALISIQKRVKGLWYDNFSSINYKIMILAPHGLPSVVAQSSYMYMFTNNTTTMYEYLKYQQKVVIDPSL